jgi:hypothetical protein
MERINGEYQARWQWKPFRGLYESRPMPANSVVHPAVPERLKQLSSYQPENLVKDYVVDVPAPTLPAVQPVVSPAAEPAELRRDLPPLQDSRR